YIFLLISLLLYSAVLSKNILTPNFEVEIARFSRSASKLFFQDVHKESASKELKESIERDEFHLLILKAYTDAGVEEIEIIPINTEKIDSNKVQVKANIVYKTTYLGEFAEDKTLTFKKENNQWKLIWDWDIVFDGF